MMSLNQGRAAREDFSLLSCPERLNGPHCPHMQRESARSTDMICCWCGSIWTEPHAQAFDRHGTFLPAPPVRETSG
jgi:hypothetical protein